MEIRYRQPILADTTVRVTARLRPPEVARLVLDYEIRDASGRLLATAETEQVVLNARGELLLTLPAAALAPRRANPRREQPPANPRPQPRG